MILRTFLAPLILIRQLTHYDSHSLEAVSHPSSSQVIDQATFPFISYLFPMMSHCVSFYYSFLFDLSSDSSCSYQCCLVVHGLPHVYKEAVLPQKKKKKQVLGLFSLLSFSQQGLYSTSLITASGLVINNSSRSRPL